VVLSLGEIAPEFGGEQVIVAYQMDGKPIDNGGGFARLILPGDKGAGRAVSAIASIEVR
jgi:DMSO/TMAO reductase YedYZ molybdopterin-dependent catalytic subunit